MSRWLEVDLLDKFTGFAGSVFTVHGTIFPFNRKRTLITDGIQRPNNLFEVDATSTQTAEVPVTARIAERHMPAKYAHLLRRKHPSYGHGRYGLRNDR